MLQNNQRYPEYVTQKEMCAILGICKSTGYALQKRGIIPFQYENTPQGRRQKINVADVLSFLSNQEQFNKSESIFTNSLIQYFTKKLCNYTSILTVSDIIQFTGYAKTTVNNWISRDILHAMQYNGKKVKSFVYSRGSIITKECFIEFVVSPYYRNIRRKSKIHREHELEYLQFFMDYQQQGGGGNA